MGIYENNWCLAQLVVIRSPKIYIGFENRPKPKRKVVFQSPFCTPKIFSLILGEGCCWHGMQRLPQLCGVEHHRGCLLSNGRWYSAGLLLKHLRGGDEGMETVALLNHPLKFGCLGYQVFIYIYLLSQWLTF